MIHFTDTWVIIEVCSSPLGTEQQLGGGVFAWQCKDWAASEGMQNKETGVKMKEGMK